MRELKFHEQKLLKKVNFLQWKSDQNLREIQVLRRYHVQNRDDYVKYSKVAGQITKLAAKLKLLKQDDPVRTKTTNLLKVVTRPFARAGSRWRRRAQGRARNSWKPRRKSGKRRRRRNAGGRRRNKL